MDKKNHDVFGEVFILFIGFPVILIAVMQERTWTPCKH